MDVVSVGLYIEYDIAFTKVIYGHYIIKYVNVIKLNLQMILYTASMKKFYA
jgi:hypothetical protein